MERERNFEVMRTVAMFFIVVYHCLTHGVGGQYGFSTTQPISLFNVLFIIYRDFFIKSRISCKR